MDNELNKQDIIGLYNEAFDLIEKLICGGKNDDRSIFWGVKFGSFAFNVSQDHIDFLPRLNSQLNLFCHTNPVIHFPFGRWQLVNELIILYFSDVNQFKQFQVVKGEALNLSTLVSFGVLEEVSRVISGYWDNDGKILKSIPDNICKKLVRINSKGNVEQVSYKVGQRIVLLSHKLILMESELKPELQHVLNEIDRITNMPVIKGVKQKYVSLYDKFESFRNEWSHGKGSQGWESLLITLMLVLIYIRQYSE